MKKFSRRVRFEEIDLLDRTHQEPGNRRPPRPHRHIRRLHKKCSKLERATDVNQVYTFLCSDDETLNRFCENKACKLNLVGLMNEVFQGDPISEDNVSDHFEQLRQVGERALAANGGLFVRLLCHCIVDFQRPTTNVTQTSPDRSKVSSVTPADIASEETECDLFLTQNRHYLALLVHVCVTAAIGHGVSDRMDFERAREQANSVFNTGNSVVQEELENRFVPTNYGVADEDAETVSSSETNTMKSATQAAFDLEWVKTSAFDEAKKITFQKAIFGQPST